MAHPFMSDLASGLASRGIASLRYQFPYMERGSKRPDPPALAHATVRAAVLEAAKRVPGCPLLAGGKSFGGRMTSQAQAKIALPGVLGLVFVGFPLHPAGKPSQERANHLQSVRMPILFLQGMRDTLATWHLIEETSKALAPFAMLEGFPDADHSFHVPRRTGLKNADVFEQLLDRMARWIDSIIAC